MKYNKYKINYAEPKMILVFVCIVYGILRLYID